jgi:hypothetical protein
MTPNVVKWRQFDDIGQHSLAAHGTKSANVAKHQIFGDIRASISRGDGGFPPFVAVISPSSAVNPSVRLLGGGKKVGGTARMAGCLPSPRSHRPPARSRAGSLRSPSSSSIAARRKAGRCARGQNAGCLFFVIEHSPTTKNNRTMEIRQVAS